MPCLLIASPRQEPGHQQRWYWPNLLDEPFQLQHQKVLTKNTKWYFFFHDDIINGNIFRVTGLLWGESTGDWWIPLTTASGAGFWCFLWCAPFTRLNNRDDGDLRRHGTHCDVTVMYLVWQLDYSTQVHAWRRAIQTLNQWWLMAPRIKL